ncbi:MAG TPA: ribose-phosphate pyrophosphokinase, partial [Bacteroidales bacterium]|nr:ribose-phosphate pyrophosphokinase [Bacteroidales bacterium]
MNSDIPVKIFSGQVTHDLAEKISHLYGTELGKSSISVFKDGEFAASYEETVRGSYLFIVQSTIPPSDNLMELLLMIDAARRASAYKIIAVIPYFGFARQDRKDRARVSIGAKLVANLLMAAGVDRVMTMDLHADQIQGFFDIPVDHLYASAVFIPYIKSLNLDNLVIASPDIGGSKRANSYAKKLEAELVICHKTREKANVVGDMTLIGDVYGKNVILLDDIIDTGGTIAKAANLIKEKGAKSVRVMVSHPVLSQNAYEIIEESKIDQLIVTDSIPLKRKSSKIEVLSIAEMFADVIKKVYRHQS